MPPHEPGLLLVNGNVLTMDPGHKRASAVAVTGGRISAVYDGRPDTSAKDVTRSTRSPRTTASGSSTPPATCA